MQTFNIEKVLNLNMIIKIIALIMHYEMRHVCTIYPVGFAIAFKCSKNVF